jgi:hypothetical protein
VSEPFTAEEIEEFRDVQVENGHCSGWTDHPLDWYDEKERWLATHDRVWDALVALCESAVVASSYLEGAEAVDRGGFFDEAQFEALGEFVSSIENARKVIGLPPTWVENDGPSIS